MDLIRPLGNEYEEYLRDESRTVGHAEQIAFPKTESELIAVMQHCFNSGTPINVQGARTGLTGGASPLGGLVLNLSRMNRITGLRYDADSAAYYLRVQPGVLLSQVRKALENKAFDISGWSAESIEVLRGVKAGALFFSPDPTETTASIGGMAACNASGARSFLYGATRRHVHALRVVLADGSVTELKRGLQKARGREFTLPLADGGEIKGQLPDFDTPQVKDAGYFFHDDMDLVDLFIGSQGTLGVISELELILMDAPRLMWGCTAFLPHDEAALNYVRVLRGEKLPNLPHFPYKPAALEFFNKNALEMILKQKEITPAFQQLQELPPDFNCAVYVEFNDADSDQFWPVLDELSQVVEAVGGSRDNTWVANGPRELEKLLYFRHTVPETIDILIDDNKKNEPCITILSTDMAAPDDCLEKLFNIYKKDLSSTNLHWVIFGHIGENHVHPNIMARNKEEFLQGHEIFKKWARDVRAMNGTITAEHGAGKIKRELALILYGEENMAKLKAFKLSLDPKNMLGPGNILS
ncbi:MAG: FAD-binding oxidoreductase [Clostridiales bacterium]|nr:FAD-binding oxidoreductase [Clostridiales bacterium]